MNILDNISKKVTEVAQVAAKKSGEVVEITKLNISINTEEDKIQKLYEEIGRIIYSYFKSQENVPDELKEICSQIHQSETNIKNYKKRILEIKSLKSCVSCGAELERGVKFCPQCGARQQTSSSKIPKDNTKDAAEDKKADEGSSSDDIETNEPSVDMPETNDVPGEEQP